MPRVPLSWLLAAALTLLPLAAPAAELVLQNQSSVPITVAILYPCGQGAMPLVQVAAQSSVGYEPPACPEAGEEPKPGRTLRLAVFDQRHDPPGFIAMSIAAKALVRLPARVIINRQYCEECDTSYRVQWIPLKTD